VIQNFTATLLKKIQVSTDVWRFHFGLDPSMKLEFKAGQYMILKVGEKRRLYSISSPDYIHDSFELLVQIIPEGVGSTFLNNLAIGEPADFQGPAGLFGLKSDTRDKIFLATGTGIAPIRSKILSVLHSLEHKISSNEMKPPSMYLFWGLRTMKDAYFVDEFIELANTYNNFSFYMCLSKETDEEILKKANFKKGRINEVLVRYFEVSNGDLSNEYEYYICGGREVVAWMHQFLLDKNVEKENIILEKF